MNKDNRIKFFCSICKHRTFDTQKGLLCNLNNKKPTFSDCCSHIEFDKAEYEKSIQQQAEAEDNDKTQSDKSGFNPTLSLICTIYGIYILIYVMGIEKPIITWINISTIILIPMLVGGYYLYLRLNQKPLNALTTKDIQEIIKIEGYYPYKEGDQICFKSDGHPYEITHIAPQFMLQFHFGFDGDYNTALLVAQEVMGYYMIGKIHIVKLPDQLGITVSVETFTYYKEELQVHFSSYFRLVNEMRGRFIYDYQQFADGKQIQNELQETQNIIVN